MLTFAQLKSVLEAGSNKTVKFVLPDENCVPMHAHITDVGTVFRHLMDCGGQTRQEAYVVLQLWVGADRGHRLKGQTLLNILEQSQVVLDELADSELPSVMVEYQTNSLSLYRLEDAMVGDEVLVFELAALSTQCLAAERYAAKTQALHSAAGCGCQTACCS